MLYFLEYHSKRYIIFLYNNKIVYSLYLAHLQCKASKIVQQNISAVIELHNDAWAHKKYIKLIIRFFFIQNYIIFNTLVGLS